MKTCVTTRCWLGVISGLGAIAISVNDRASAQIVPDASLGGERSVVRPNIVIRGVPSDRIDGGAIRGSNLFHSFEQFNIGAGRGAYFANPAGIENILSRVTGNSRSEILGRLGVLGNANLFLLNPNGIVFGANASLDVAGSFTASTANAIQFGNQGFFSATQPDKSSLLAIAPGALFFDQQVRQPKTIQNSGNLTAGRDLTLAADNLELQGQLRSGGNLTLQAQDTLRIRDSVTAPFIASAGGKLLVQGDRTVDIFALNHPDSGLFSGSNMVLRSANTIGGDAHYYSGGDFRVEQLDGSLGSLVSPHDPVFQVLGDFSLLSYNGASLQILAGGSVFIPGGVTITGSGGGFNDSVVQLSDTTQRSVLGTSIPTLEIRAGTTEFFRASPLFTGILPPSGSNIVIGNIAMTAFGGVLLTNQIAPNPLLYPGAIVTGGIQTFGGEVVIDASGGVAVSGDIDVSIASGIGGDITIFGGLGGIDTRGSTLRSVSGNGNAGNVVLTANQNIFTGGIQAYVGAGGTGNGGNITISSKNGAINTTVGTLYSSATKGNGGVIKIDALGDISTAGIQSLVGAQGNGSAGQIALTSRGGSINTTAFAPDFSGALFSGIQSLVGEDGIGYGGDVSLTAFGNIITGNIESRVGARGVGFAGKITLFSTLGLIDTTAGTLSSSTENGISGKITLDAFDNIYAGNIEAFSTGTAVGQAGEINITSTDGSFFLSGHSVSSQASGVAAGGSISVSADSVFLTNQAAIASSTFGQGDAGKLISVLANGIVSLSGSSQIRGTVEPGGNGKASDILIQARALLVTDGSQVQTSLFREVTDSTSGNVTPGGRGQGGNIGIIASDLIYISGTNSDGFSSGLLTLSERGASGPAGNIAVDVGTGNFNNLGTGLFRVENGGSVIASTRNNGNGGDVTINSRVFEALAGGRILAASGNLVDARGTTTGLAGTITVNASDRVIISGKDPNFQNRLRAISTFVNEPTAGGTTKEDILIRDSNNGASGLFVDTQDAGRGGFINVITSNSFALTDGAQIDSETFGKGGLANAGIVSVQSSGSVLLNDSRIFSSVESGAEGNAGGIFISGASISLENQAQLQTQTSGSGDAGRVFLQADSGTGTVSLNNSDIFSSVQSGAIGNAGGIFISAASISLNNQAQLQAQTGGNGNAGLVYLQAKDGTIVLDDRSVVFDSVLPGAVGVAGGILVDTGTLTVNNQSGFTANTLTTNLGCRGIGGCNAGVILLQSTQNVSFNNNSAIVSEVGENAIGTAGGIALQVDSFSASNNSGLSTSTFGQGDAGLIFVTSKEDISLSGASSGIFSGVGANSTSKGGSIRISARNIFVRNGAEISVNNKGLDGEAGSLAIEARSVQLDREGRITGTTDSGRGGNIALNTSNSLLLRRNSNISTTAGLRPAGGDGGNITINTPFIIATPSKNSNITAQAYTGSGGAVTINGTALFGIAPRTDDFPTSNDITTSSRFGLAGTTNVNALDGSFLENSLTEFPQNLIDPNTLLANSCIVRNREKKRGPNGTFLVTGSGGLPVRPGDPPPSPYPTGEVRSVPEGREGEQREQGKQREQGENNMTQNSPDRSWKPGDPIVEPQGIYRLANGKLVMSRECEP